MSHRNPTGNGLDQKRFEQMLAAYGSHPDAWPTEHRQGAQALLEASAECRQLLAQEAVLDGMLDQAPAHEPSRGLRQRVLDAAPRVSNSWAQRLDRWASGLWPLGRSWQPVGVLAVAAALGIVAGFQLTALDPEQDAADVASVALDDFADLGDLP